jgi:hypothetical protein
MDSCVIKPAPLLALQPGCLHDVMDVEPETYPWDLPDYPWRWANPEDYDSFFDADDGDDSDWTESDN